MSFLNLLTAVLFLVLAHLILAWNRGVVNKLFAITLICFSWWATGLFFLYQPDISRETALLISRITSAGWLLAPAFFLWFIIAYVQGGKAARNPGTVWFLLGFPLVLLAMNFNGWLIRGVTRTPLGWAGIWGWTPGSMLGVLYICGFVITGVVMGWRYIQRASDPVRVRQMRIVLYSATGVMIVALVVDILLPLVMTIPLGPDFSPIAALLWAAVIVYAMVRYRFLMVTPVTAAENIIDAMHDGLIILDDEMRIGSLNRAARDLLAGEIQDFEKKGLATLFPGGARARALIAEMSLKREVRNSDVELQTLKGERIPVLWSASPVTGRKGRVKGQICIVKDIRDIKNNEVIRDVVLRISRASTRTTDLQDLLATVQRQVGRLMDARNFYVALVEDREKALYRFPYITDIHPEEVEHPHQVVALPDGFTHYVVTRKRPVLANREQFDRLMKEEKLNLIGNRSTSWMGVPLKTPDDEVMGVIVLQSYTDGNAFSESDLYVLTVISNSVSSAIRFKQAQDALRDSESHYRTLVENIRDGVFLLSSRRIIFVNRAFAEIAGGSPGGFTGIRFSDLVEPASQERVDRWMEEISQGSHGVSGREFRLMRRGGEAVSVSMNCSPILYRGRKAILGTVEDISRRERVLREKRRLEKRLARVEKMEAVGQLAGGVAHDLNNILGAIVGYPELMVNRIEKDEELKRMVYAIQKSGNKAAEIVQDLLSLARRGVTLREPVDFNDVVEQYLESLVFSKVQEYHPGIDFQHHLAEDLPPVEGAPVNLSKVLMNLVSNAAEAIPDCGQVSISTAHRRMPARKGYYREIPGGEYVVLAVRDTGVGIPDPDLKKIFEPFFTKKKMGRSGTGLGMAVVQGVVEDHGGFIDVESSANRGTCFTLYFPVSRKADSSGEVEKPPVRDYRGRGECILVVDDLREQREVARSLLEQLKYRVVTVSSGAEALEYLDKGEAGMVLLDMVMENGMDGLDTYRRIREAHPRLGVVITSGYAESERVREALSLGARGFVKKPFRMKNLGETIRTGLEEN